MSERIARPAGSSPLSRIALTAISSAEIGLAALRPRGLAERVMASPRDLSHGEVGRARGRRSLGSNALHVLRQVEQPPRGLDARQLGTAFGNIAVKDRDLAPRWIGSWTI